MIVSFITYYSLDMLLAVSWWSAKTTVYMIYYGGEIYLLYI